MRLKTVDKMVVQAAKRGPETEVVFVLVVVLIRAVIVLLQVDDVADYDYDNPADNDGYCPDIDDEQDAYGRCAGLPAVFTMLLSYKEMPWTILPNQCLKIPYWEVTRRCLTVRQQLGTTLWVTI